MVSLLGIQIIGILLSAVIFYYAQFLYKKGKFSRRDQWIWSGFSVIMFIISLLPSFFGQILSIFIKLQRGLDASIVLGLLAAYALIFQVYVRIQQTNRELTELTRKIALELEERKKKGK